MHSTRTPSSRQRCGVADSPSSARCSECAVPLDRERVRQMFPVGGRSPSSPFSDLSSHRGPMRLPERINSDAELENVLAAPSESDLAFVSRLSGDVLILGAGGKMGPSLARRIHRA